MTRQRLALGLLAAGAFAAAGCEGTTPPINGSPERGISAVVIGGKIVLPTGETRSGKMWIDLEAEENKDERAAPEIYRLIARPQRTLMYQVEPGVYHYAPARSVFGFSEATLSVKTEGHTFHVPFPRDILRRPAIKIRPAKIVALGVLEATLTPAMPGRKQAMKVRLDDTVATRRKIVQDLIHDMMDPNTPAPVRESAVAWTGALDQTLEDLAAEAVRAAPYKAGP